MKKSTSILIILSILLLSVCASCERAPAETDKKSTAASVQTAANTFDLSTTQTSDPSSEEEPSVRVERLVLPFTRRYQTTVGGLYRLSYDSQNTPRGAWGVRVQSYKNYEANVLGDGTEKDFQAAWLKENEVKIPKYLPEGYARVSLEKAREEAYRSRFESAEADKGELLITQWYTAVDVQTEYNENHAFYIVHAVNFDGLLIEGKAHEQQKGNTMRTLCFDDGVYFYVLEGTLDRDELIWIAESLSQGKRAIAEPAAAPSPAQNSFEPFEVRYAYRHTDVCMDYVLSYKDTAAELIGYAFDEEDLSPEERLYPAAVGFSGAVFEDGAALFSRADGASFLYRQSRASEAKELFYGNDTTFFAALVGEKRGLAFVTSGNGKATAGLLWHDDDFDYGLIARGALTVEDLMKIASDLRPDRTPEEKAGLLVQKDGRMEGGATLACTVGVTARSYEDCLLVEVRFRQDPEADENKFFFGTQLRAGGSDEALWTWEAEDQMKGGRYTQLVAREKQGDGDYLLLFLDVYGNPSRFMVADLSLTDEPPVFTRFEITGFGGVEE